VNGKLTSVTDPFARAFTFGYTGNLLTSVTDSTRNVQFTYTGNNLTNFRDARLNNWGYEYDASNRLTKIKKANPATTALTTNVYDALDRVQTQTDALGNVTDFYWGIYRNVERAPNATEWVASFNANYLYAMRQDQQGKRMWFAYDGLGRLIRGTDRLGDSITITYHNASGRIATMTNPRGNVTTYTYTPRNTNLYDLTRIDYPTATYEAYTYNANGDALTYRNRAGNTWTYTVNARGQRLTETNPTAGVTTFTYNADGTLASRDDGDTNPTTFQYDGFRRLNRENYPNGTNRQYVYDANDNLTQITDARGFIYNFTFDANNDLTNVVRASGTPIQQTHQYQYDALDRMIRFIDAGSNQTDFTYTFWNGLSRITYPDGAQVNINYDTRQWLSGITDEASQTWQLARNDESVPASFTTPQNRVTQFASNQVGSITGITDPLNKTVTFTRDAMEEVTQITDRLNRAMTMTRNGEEELTSVSLPIIGAATYTRNALGLVTRITDQRGNNWDFAYTANGRISQTKDPKNQTWNFTYDTTGRIATVTYPDSVTETRTYDGNNNLTSRTFSTGLTMTFTYDQLNRVSTTASVALGFTYDTRDHVTNTAMGGANFGATFDARGRIATMTYDGQMTVTYQYDARNLVTQVSDNKANAWVQFSYDNDRLPTQIRRSNGITTDITRDSNGRITKIKHGTKGEMTYTLDAEDQILQVLEDLPVDVAAYLAPELIAYTYNAANEISSAGFVYDVRGRRTQDPSRTYTWDAADRLTQIVNGATTTTFDYTALGDCARRTVGGVLTEYFFAYSMANKPIVAEKRAGAYVRFYVYTPDGRLLYLVNATNNQPAFYHFNRVGTTLFLTDASGNVADTYGYTPYGQMVKHNGSNDQPFTFVGEYGVRQEGDTGIYQMRVRYYDPQTIRFLSRDPFGPNLIEPKSINPYAYAAQNPLSFIDPTGMYWVNAAGNPLGGSVPAQSIAETYSNGTIVGWVDETNGVVNWKVARGSSLDELGSTVLIRRNLLKGMFGREIGIKVGELTTTANQGKPLDPVVPPGKEFFTPEVQNIVDFANASCSCKCDTALVSEQNDLSALGQNAWVLIGFVALMALVWMGVRVTMGRKES
jgi:RHS repeat-associated protein